jgi:hypothetical protein
MMKTANLFVRYRFVGGKRSGLHDDDAAQSLSAAHANKLAHLVQFVDARLRTGVCHGR